MIRFLQNRSPRWKGHMCSTDPLCPQPPQGLATWWSLVLAFYSSPGHWLFIQSGLLGPCLADASLRFAFEAFDLRHLSCFEIVSVPKVGLFLCLLASGLLWSLAGSLVPPAMPPVSNLRKETMSGEKQIDVRYCRWFYVQRVNSTCKYLKNGKLQLKRSWLQLPSMGNIYYLQIGLFCMLN